MEEKIFDEYTKEIIEKAKEFKIEKNYSTLGLKFNPFPPAAIPRFPSLPPLDKEAENEIKNFILSTYSHYGKKEFIDYAGLTIIGEYGMGKTHLMKFMKILIDKLSEVKKEFSSVTCYIDRPEDRPQNVIHRIVEQIGLDSIRKYVWKILVDEFQKDVNSFYESFKPKGFLATPKDKWDKLFEEPTRSNYLDFLDKFERFAGNLKKLQEKSREIMKNKKIVSDDTLADRYLGLLFIDKKASTSWDILAGYISSRDLQRREVQFLNSIVKILKENDFNMLYVFVDEFEDVSKLKGVKLTNYLLTLNTLINNQRRWAIIVSLTGEALNKIKEESPPLYDRLVSFRISLSPLNEEKAKKLTINYLNLARDKKEDSTAPFSEKSIKKIWSISKGNYRSFIRLAHKSIEYAISNKLSPPIKADTLEKIKDVVYDET